jgi:hypothetical protein
VGGGAHTSAAPLLTADVHGPMYPWNTQIRKDYHDSSYSLNFG